MSNYSKFENATIFNAQNCKIVKKLSKALFLHRFHRSQSKKMSLKTTWELLQILEICKVASNVAKCENSSRNIKKFKFTKFPPRIYHRGLLKIKKIKCEANKKKNSFVKICKVVKIFENFLFFNFLPVQFPKIR